MIQKISFGSKFTIKNYSNAPTIYPHAIVTSIARDTMQYLEDGDEISLSKEGNKYSINVPDYLDDKVKTVLLYKFGKNNK